MRRQDKWQVFIHTWKCELNNYCVLHNIAIQHGLKPTPPTTWWVVHSFVGPGHRHVVETQKFLTFLSCKQITFVTLCYVLGLYSRHKTVMVYLINGFYFLVFKVSFSYLRLSFICEKLDDICWSEESLTSILEFVGTALRWSVLGRIVLMVHVCFETWMVSWSQMHLKNKTKAVDTFIHIHII